MPRSATGGEPLVTDDPNTDTLESWDSLQGYSPAVSLFIRRWIQEIGEHVPLRTSRRGV
jgi:hypothetical protein